MAVNIQVTAEVAQALKALGVLGTEGAAALAKVEVAGHKAAAGVETMSSRILENNRKLKSAIGGIALNASLFAGPQAQQFIYPLFLMQKELKGLSAAAKIAGLTLPGVGVAVAGISVAVAAGVKYWQVYREEMAAAAAVKRNFYEKVAFSTKLDDRLKRDVELDRLPKDQADALRAKLKAALPGGFKDEKYTDKVLMTTPTGGSHMVDVERTRRIFSKDKLEDVQKEVLALLRVVDLTEEQIKQLDELKNKKAELHVESLSGYAKERAAEQKRFEEETRNIESIAKSLNANIDEPGHKFNEDDNNKIAELRITNQLINSQRIKEIDKKEWEEKVKNALTAQEQMDKIALDGWERTQKEIEQRQQQKLQSIQSSQFLSAAEKYDQTRAAGGDVSGIADPSDFTQQMSSQFVQLQNQIGTFSQASAGLITGGLGAAMDGVSQSIMGVIDGTKNMGQIWGSIMRQMLAEAVRFGVQQLSMFLLNMGKKVAAHIMGEGSMTTSTVVGSGVRTKANIKEAGSGAVNTGIKAAGSVADIPYVGWALAIAAFAGVIAMVAQASGGFKSGGYTGAGPMDEVAGPVHRGEWVMPQKTVAAWGKENMARIQRGPGAVVTNRESNAEATRGGSGSKIQQIAVFFDKSMLTQYLRDNSDAIVVDAIRRNKVELGFNT